METENITKAFITLNTDTTNGTLYTEINYLFTLNNNFDFDIFNINIFLKIPKYTKLKANSLLLNNEAITIDSDLLLNIKKLRKEETLTLKYSVVAVSIPSSGKIDNMLQICYDAKEFTKVNAYSNVVTTLINGVNLVIDKYTDKADYYLNDNLTLFVKLKNTGNIPALNLIYSEILPENIKLLNLYINNYEIPNKDLSNLPLGRIDEGASISIRIDCILSSKSTKPQKFISKLSYNYYDDFFEELKFEKGIEKALIPNFQFDILDNKNGLPSLKTNTDLLFINEGSRGFFSISNMGTTLLENLEIFINSTSSLSLNNIALNNNVIFKKYNPLKDSIKLSNFGVNETLDITFDFSLINLSLRENELSIYITYDIFNSSKNYYEHKSYTSNKVEIQSLGILFENSTLIKTTDKSIYKKDELIESEIKLKSLGNLNSVNMRVYEGLNPLFEYVENSFSINNKPIIGNLSEGFFIQNINLDEDLSIKYTYKVNCDNSLLYTPPLTFIEFTEPSINYSKVFEAIPSPINILNPLIVDTESKNTIDEILYTDLIDYTLNLENKGNLSLYDIYVNFDIPRNFEIVNIKASTGDYSISLNNTLKILKFNPNEVISINLKIKATSIDVSDVCSIDAVVSYNYSYDNINSSDRFLTKTTSYNIVKPSLIGEINLKNDLFLSSQDLEGILSLKNTGNIPLNISNIILKEYGMYNLNDDFKISLRDDEEVILKSNDEIQFDFSLNLKASRLTSINELSLISNYSYEFNNKSYSSFLCLNSKKINILNNSLTCKLTSSKKQYIIDEVASFNILISNCGVTDMKDSILYLDIPDSFNIENQFISFNDSRYSLKDLKTGFNLGTILKDSSIFISFNLLFTESNLFTELISSFRVFGNFIVENSSNKIECLFTSNNVNISVYKLGLQSFISSNKDVLLLNDEITFSTTLINTSSMPINLKYNLITSSELVEVVNTKRCDGELLKEGENNILLPINDGITIDTTYIYKSFNGTTNILSHGEIEVLDSQKLFSNPKLFKTENIQTTLTNNNFKELIIEEIIDSLSFSTPVKEVLNTYVNSKIINFATIPLYRDLNYFKKELVGYKINFYGELNYSIEYISSSKDEDEDDAIFIENITRFFNSSINLPSSFTNDKALNLSSSLIDVANSLINNKIYITVNLLIDINI